LVDVFELYDVARNCKLSISVLSQYPPLISHLLPYVGFDHSTSVTSRFPHAWSLP